MERRGHHVHEAGPRMWVPYAILAVASIAIGVIGFVFEAELHHLFSEYLAESFGIHSPEEDTEEGRFKSRQRAIELGLD